MVPSYNKGNGCTFTLVLFMVEVPTVYMSLLHFGKWWRTQQNAVSLHPNDVFTNFPNNAITKMSADNRHISQHLSTSSSDSVRWTSSSVMTANLGVDCAQQNPDTGKILQPTTWVSGTPTHCHRISCRPHQQFWVLLPHTACTLIQERYFKSVDTLGCNVTRRWLSWFDTCSALSHRARQWQHISETWSASYTLHKRSLQTCSASSTAVLPVPFIQSTYKRWGRHYTKRYCQLKGRGKMYSFPCCECDIITQCQNVWSPQSEITMFYWSFLFFMKWCNSTQSSALYIQPESWHGILCLWIKQ